MDEIKFRAWDAEHKLLIRGITLHGIWNPTNATEYPYRNCIMMQFTGLCDKNGKEIYVGDLFGNGELLCEVRREKSGEYKLHFLNKKQTPISIIHPIVSRSEIVGNIYESA